jgi:hypothetical protein
MIEWRGDAYRATTYDEPLWVSANRRSGRFNLAGVGSTQYLCLDSEAPLAEMLRAEDLRDDASAATFVTILWQLRVDEGAVVDYSSFEKAEAAGFPAEALVEDDHERCQKEAQRLRSLGARALLTPSAALPGSANLTVFGPRAPVSWNTTVRLASTIPVQRLSQGSAPRGLSARVRYYGQAHSRLVTYERSTR